ncbi:MAG: beta-ketoacyl-ACP synthase III [Thermoguttaceae bacterium]|nr:beta-ketoacyl-ACP synthase III [Thermoguttaceae bacterium]
MTIPSELPRSDELLMQPRRSRIGRLMGVQAIGMGSAVAGKLVRNEDLAELGYDADWIVQRTGIHERRHATEDVATSDLAVEAAERCIESAGVDRRDIDLVLLGTYTPDVLMPATACLIQDRLGVRAPAIDLQAACASFVFSMITGAQYVATGCSRLALVIGADCTSRVLDPADERTYPLFGDAAGAVLLAAGSEGQGLLSYAVGSDGSGAKLLYRPMGGSREPFSQHADSLGRHFMQMEGRPIFKWVVRMLRETCHEVLEAADLTLQQVNLFIFHQANLRIISSAVDDMGIDPSRVFNNLQRYGNTSSASIPLALDEAYRQGRIERGDLVLFSGFGGGLTWGTALMRW